MCFGVAWNVHVHAIHSLETVVLEVVLLECDRHGDTYREVGEDPEQTVVGRSGEGEIVADLMDCQEEVVIKKCAEEVGYSQDFKPPCMLKGDCS